MLARSKCMVTGRVAAKCKTGLNSEDGPENASFSASVDLKAFPRREANNFAQTVSVLIFVGFVAAGNGVRIREPPVEIDVPASLGTERARGRGGRLTADRARLLRPL